MKRKIMSAILVLGLALSLASPAFAAYSDLQNHWSKQYMEDLATRGYLTGYTDGTMKPEKKMTACETLAILSRFYKPSDEASKLITADFQSLVSSTVPATLNWAYDELAVCLAAGIITESELKTVNLAADIKKAELSVFLVRAMQLEAEAQALKDETLSFADADKISAEAKGYVAELKKLGIVSGDDKNNFSPNLTVSRAVVAAMISRSLDYLELKNKTLTIDAYEGIKRTEGIITSAANGSVELRGYDGLTRYFSVPVGAAVTVNGTVKPLSAVYVGYRALLSMKSGAVTKVQITSETDTRWLQGNLNGLTAASGTLTVKNSVDGSMAGFKINSNAKITEDGVTVQFSQLDLGCFLTLKIQKNEVTEIIAATNDVYLNGTVSDMTFGLAVRVKVTDENGIAYILQMDIANMPKILRGTKTITVDRLNVGDIVTVTMENGTITLVTATGTANTIQGELISIVSTTNGTTWAIKIDDGTTTSYTVDPSAVVFNGTTAILLSSIKAGDKVSVVVYGNTVTEVYLISALTTSTKLTATVLTVDTAHNKVTVLTSANNLVYIDTRWLTSIIKASTGASIQLSSVTTNAQIVAYGTYSDSTTFKATSIIVEN
jgi:hypothetical protein